MVSNEPCTGIGLHSDFPVFKAVISAGDDLQCVQQTGEQMQQVLPHKEVQCVQQLLPHKEVQCVRQVLPPCDGTVLPSCRGNNCYGKIKVPDHSS